MMAKPKSFMSRMRARAHAKTFDQVLASGGNAQSLSDEIERDFSGLPVTRSPFHVGRKWCLYVRGKIVVLLPIQSLVWAYGDDAVLADNPIFKAPQIVLWRPQGPGLNLAVTKAEATAAMKQLAQAAPWLPVGYSPAMVETWNNDHPNLIAMVHRARSEGRPFRELFPADLDEESFKPPEYSNLSRAALVVAAIAVIAAVSAYFLWRSPG